MVKPPFQAGIQDFVHSVDVGIGQWLVRGTLYLAFIIIIMLLYTGSQFKGLKDQHAMEYAQLGRNLAETGQLTTKVVRPATMRFLIEHSKDGDPRVDNHPDILHPPLYPLALSTAFKLLKPDFQPDVTVRDYPADRWGVLFVCHAFTLLTGLFVVLIGAQLFSWRIGLLGTAAYFLSDTVWAHSISGTNFSMVTCAITAAIYLLLASSSKHEKSGSPAAWISLLVLAGLAMAAAVLTRYAAVAIVPGLALYVLQSFRRGWLWALMFCAIILVALVPWLSRNHAVSGAWLGLSGEAYLAESRIYPDDAWDRALVTKSPDGKDSYAAIQAKVLTNLKEFYQKNLRTMGNGLLVCLFLTTYFYRFVKQPVHRLRWAVAASAVCLFIGAAFYGGTSIDILLSLWPIVILYGLAFFFLLLDRLQLPLQIQRIGVITLFMILAAAPLVFTLMPPRTVYPYPPYFVPYIAHVTNLMEEEEILCTDMPWATAWYGDCTSLLLPQTVDDFYKINDEIKRVNGLYFTTLTRNKPYARSLLSGKEKSWLPIQQGRMPADFPLTQGFPMHNLDQLFMTDRNRLADRSN